MKLTVGQYLNTLLKQSGCTQSQLAREIGISRQALSYIMLGQRTITLPISLKLESVFSLPEGKILKIQSEYDVAQYKLKLKKQLFDELLEAHAFWSYDNVTFEQLSDEMLIENVLIHLDIEAIDKLFQIYTKKMIRKVWENTMAFQGEYLFDLNVMIALYYFNIPKPEKYLQRQENKHLKQLLNYDERNH